MIIQDENSGGGETARDEGLLRVPVRRGRDRYGSKRRLTLHAAARGVLYSSTQARQRGDVTDKNDGQKVKDKQDSATRVMGLNRKRRGLTIYAPRNSGNRAGTRHSGLGQSTVDRWSNQLEM